MIAADMLPSSPMQPATSPAALLERFGPHEVAIAARKSSAKLPVEQAPSVIADPPVAVAAYALGITCTADAAATVAAITANAAAIMVPGKIIFVLIPIVFFIVVLHEKLQKMDFDRKLYVFIEVIFYDLKHTYKEE